MNGFRTNLFAKFTAVSIVVGLGYLLTFIGFFLPWYRISIYGKETVYSGFSLAEGYATLWFSYFIPLLAAIGVIGILIYGLASERIKVSPKWISVGLSGVLIVITIIVLMISPAPPYPIVFYDMGLGIYAVVTGSIVSFIFSFF